MLTSIRDSVASAPLLSVNITTGLTNKTSKRSRIANSTATFAQELRAELQLWATEMKEEVAAAAAKAQAIAGATARGTLPSVTAATLAREKAKAIDLVSDRFLSLFSRRASKASTAVDSLTAAADAALEAWNDASDGGLPAQIYAAKLAIVAFQVSTSTCELQNKVNQARALGLLPLPLAATEAYAPQSVPVSFLFNATGALAPTTGARRRKTRRSLLSAAARSRGRALLQDSASVELAALESSLPTRALPTCCAAGIEVSQQAALAKVQGFLKNMLLKFTSKDRPLDESEYLSAARSYLFQCLPEVDIDNPSANKLPNVALVARLMSKSLWSNSTLAVYAQNGPTPNGRFQAADPATPAPSGPMPQVNLKTVDQLYRSFLQSVGRYPFFCGERGAFATVEDACRRELAGFMANGAQETGAGYDDASWPSYLGPVAPSSYQQAFAYSREQNLYQKCASGDVGCLKYDPWPWNKANPSSCGAGLPCAQGLNYYGRGWHQTSYAFNYFAFGAAATPTDVMQFVANPDLLGQNPINALLSAFQFAMTTTPPKPSIHEAVLGIYTPPNATFSNTGNCIDPPEKININVNPATGLVVNQWMTTISVINGGVECRNGNPVVQAQTRTKYYIDWLAQLGVPPSAMTPAERATLFKVPNDPSSGPNSCNICQGNPFTAEVRFFYFCFLSWIFFVQRVALFLSSFSSSPRACTHIIVTSSRRRLFFISFGEV